MWLWLIFAMNTNMRTWIQVVQPAIVEEYRLSATVSGLFSGILLMAVGVGGIAISPWVSGGGSGWARKYRHLPVAGIYLLFSILTGFAPLTVFFGAILVFQVIKSLASGGGEASEVTAVAEWWPAERRGFVQGLHHTAYPWGTLFGGLGVSLIYTVFGSENWRYVFLLLPLPLLPILVGYWRWSNASNYQKFVEDTQRRGLTLPVTVDHASAPVRAPRGAFARALRNPNVAISALCAGIANMGYQGLSFWLPMYLTFVANYPLAEVATYSVLFTVTGGLGQIAWGAISDRFGRKPSLVVMFLWLALAFVLFQFSGISIVALVAIQLFAGMATNGVYPVLYALASDSSEPGATAIGNGLNIGGLILGGCGPLIVGWLISAGGGYASSSGFLVSLYFLAIAMVLAAALVAFFTRETIGSFKPRDRALVSAEKCRVPID